MEKKLNVRSLYSAFRKNIDNQLVNIQIFIVLQQIYFKEKLLNYRMKLIIQF